MENSTHSKKFKEKHLDKLRLHNYDKSYSGLHSLNQKQDPLWKEPKAVKLFHPCPTNSLKALLVPYSWFSLSRHQK